MRQVHLVANGSAEHSNAGFLQWALRYEGGNVTEIRKALGEVNTELARRNGIPTRSPIYLSWPHEARHLQTPASPRPYDANCVSRPWRKNGFYTGAAGDDLAMLD